MSPNDDVDSAAMSPNDDADSAAMQLPFFEHPALHVQTIQGLGDTFVVLQHIPEGTLLLCEPPTLVASALSSLPAAEQQMYRDGAAELECDVDDLMVVHAFARAEPATRAPAPPRPSTAHTRQRHCIIRECNE